MNDKYWMSKALKLADKANNCVSPNPRVGCVVVKYDRMIAGGYHKIFGGPHAEAVALKKAGKRAKGATVYVTLEPCVHSNKKTPPCVPLMVHAGVKKVFVAMQDPNPLVRRKGIRALRKAGIDVKVGLLQRQAREINNAFVTWVIKKRPFVVLKMAFTLDGKITSSKRWISNRLARKAVQHLRAQVDGVLVGVNTVLRDNPRLTCRIKGAKQPLRIVLDSLLRCPLNARVFKDSNALVATTDKAPLKKVRQLQRKGVQVLLFRRRIDLHKLLRELAKKGISFLLVEGGSRVASSFLRHNLVDRGLFFVAPVLAGQGVPLVKGIQEQRFTKVNVSTLQDNALFEVTFTKTSNTRR